MTLPELDNIRRSMTQTYEFGGLNRRPVIGTNEFEELDNLSGDGYPALKTRERRWIVGEPLSENTKLYFNQNLIRLIPQENGPDVLNYGGNVISEWTEQGLSRFSNLPTILNKATADANDISMASIGAYVVFMPYRAWFNTETMECGALGYNFSKKENDPNKTVGVYIGYDNSGTFGAPGKVYLSHDASGLTIRKSDNTGWSSYTPSQNDVMWYGNALYRKGASDWTMLTESLTVTNPPGFYFRFTVSPAGSYPENMNNGDRITVKIGYRNTMTNTDATYDVTGTVENLTDSTSFSSFCIKQVVAPPKSLVFACQTSTDPTNGIHAQTVSIDKGVAPCRFITALDNRIWGCDLDGHEISCCKQGDIFDWSTTTGEGGAWIATVGEGKEWTGAVTYDKTVYFFKKDRVFKVVGSRPSNFGYREISMRGCYDNASISVVADRLMYMGADGIYEYYGSYPTRISDKVNGTWKAAIGGAFRNNYYCFRTGWDGSEELLHYDLETGAWYREPATKWYSTARGEDTLYYAAKIPDGVGGIRNGYRMLTVSAAASQGDTSVSVNEILSGSDMDMPVHVGSEENTITAIAYSEGATTSTVTLGTALSADISVGTKIISRESTRWCSFRPISEVRPVVNPYNEVEEPPLEWVCVTGDQMSDIPGNKYISALDLSIKLGEGATCKVYIQYDYTGNWISIKDITRANKDTETIRFLPRRCRHFRLKFQGVGEFTLYNLTKTVEEAKEYG